MKHPFIILAFLSVVCYSYAQTPKVTADTFFYSQKFLFKKLIIRSDSTYCLREKGCISTSLSMGFWTKQNDMLLLSGLSNSFIIVKTETLTDEGPNDSLIIFEVKDCFGNPISEYFIDFYTKDTTFDISDTNDYRTDKNGILKLRRGKYGLYSTESDEANNEYFERNCIVADLRPILQNTKSITIIINFPKEIIQANLLDISYKYKSRKFKIQNKQLLDIEAGHNYIKK